MGTMELELGLAIKLVGLGWLPSSCSKVGSEGDFELKIED